MGNILLSADFLGKAGRPKSTGSIYGEKLVLHVQVDHAPAHLPEKKHGLSFRGAGITSCIILFLLKNASTCYCSVYALEI